MARTNIASHIPEVGYTEDDKFYHSNDSYHAFNTCNEWVNRGLKQSGVKTAIWSPAAFGLFKHTQNYISSPSETAF